MEQLYAVAGGEVYNIESAPDPVFSQKVLGEGYLLNPSSGVICAPCDGTIIEISDTCHAIGIASTEGSEILVHIGINTVELGCKYFSLRVKKGDRVKHGEPICVADLNGIEKANYSTLIPVIVTTDTTYFKVYEGECDKCSVVAEFGEKIK